jgi:hypothetical protein
MNLKLMTVYLFYNFTHVEYQLRTSKLFKNRISKILNIENKNRKPFVSVFTCIRDYSAAK